MKVYVWGHPYGTHTTSYVIEAFARAFAHMGHEVVRVDGGSPSAVAPGSLILSEGMVDQHVPVRKDLRYILHNCDRRKYESVLNRTVNIGVVTSSIGDGSTYQKVRSWAHWDAGSRTLFHPWATSLLPHEIKLAWVDLPRRPIIHYVGTVVARGMNNNWGAATAFALAALRRGIPFYAHGGYTGAGIHGPLNLLPGRPNETHHRQLIQESFVAPTLVGDFQMGNEYIPCRAFKNISFGQPLVTNSPAIHKFFNEAGICNVDCGALFEDALRDSKKQNLIDLMVLVRDEHTFVNRIKAILEVL